MDEQEILQSALNCSSADERIQYLDSACKGDLELRARVERLVSDRSTSESTSASTVDVSDLSATAAWGSDSTQDPEIVKPQPVTEVSIPMRRLGNYELREMLGRGGMGVVTLGLDCKLRRIVAIKTLLPVFASDPHARQRFLREAQAAAAVRHDNIVTIHAVEEEGETPFLVMEYISGKTLKQKIAQSGLIGIDDIIRIAMQIAAALDAAHRIGLIHRDIKPANILLEGDSERVKITDFGLARVVGDVGLTHSGEMVGTPQYMSPEQAQGLAADHRSDLFSLGCVMYSMCTGSMPFRADSAIVVLRLVCDVHPSSIQNLRNDVPQWLCQLIEKLMAKRPEDRPQSAAEVERALRAGLDWTISSKSLIDTEPTLFRSVIAPRPSRRSKTVPILVIAACLMAASIASWQFLTQPVRGPEKSNQQLVQNANVSMTGDVIRPAPQPRINPILSPDFEWTIPVNLGSNVNTPGNEDHACISADGRTLLFTRWSGGMQTIFQSQRSNIDEPFGKALRLSDDINLGDHSEAPYLTWDGLTLWFVSNRPDGYGGHDIWVSRRASADEPFGPPVNAGRPINTANDEASPYITSDGLFLLYGQGHPRKLMLAMRANRDAPFGEPQALNVLNVGSWSEFPRPTSDHKAIIFVLLAKDGQQRLVMSTRIDGTVEFDPPIDLGPRINEGIMSGPALSADDEILYFSSNRPDGFGGFDLWSARRVRKSAASEPVDKGAALTPTQLLTSAGFVWSPVQDLQGAVNTDGYEAGSFVTADSLSLLFQSNENRQNLSGPLRIWQAWRQSVNDPFQNVTLLDAALNDQPNSLAEPTLSADGLTLVFNMVRDDGQGTTDLWIVDRPAGDAPWGPPVNAGAGVNSARDEWEPELSPDGLTLLFHSNRDNSNGGTDLWIARREARNVPFGQAENMGAGINTDDNEGGAAFSSDGLTLLFHRYPNNPGRQLTHWQTTRKSVQEPFEKPTPLLVPGMVEQGGMSLSLSPPGDCLFCTLTIGRGVPNIGISRRVPRLQPAP